MDNDRNNRDDGRDNNWDNLGYRGTGSSFDDDRSRRSRRDYGNNDGWRSSDDNWRDDNRRYHGGGSFSGTSREDYGSRGNYNADRSGYADRNYGDRGFNAGGRGGYDEWPRNGSRSSGDRQSSSQGYGGFYGDRDRNSANDDRNRWSGGQSYGGGERGYSQGGRGFWDKAGDEVSSWFGDRDAEQRREQDQHRGRGPKNYTRSDDRIRDDVNDRLTDDGWLDASNVDVSVKDREVTLTGTVTDRNAKRRAEDIAEGVSGVSHVQNNLRIKSNDATLSGTDVDVDRSTAGMVAKSTAGGQR